MHSLNWTPGAYGKGLYTVDGDLHTWNTTGEHLDGYPTHRDYIREHLGYDPYRSGFRDSSDHGYFAIYPQGGIYRLNRENQADFWKRAVSIDPRLSDVDPEPVTWNIPHTGAWIPPVLYHWTEGRNIPHLHEHGLPPAYLTSDHDVEHLNADVPRLEHPFRLTIDTGKLDPHAFGQNEDEGYGGTPEQAYRAQGNAYYTKPIPREAIIAIDKFRRPAAWEDSFDLPLTHAWA